MVIENDSFHEKNTHLDRVLVRLHDLDCLVVADEGIVIHTVVARSSVRPWHVRGVRSPVHEDGVFLVLSVNHNVVITRRVRRRPHRESDSI